MLLSQYIGSLNSVQIVFATAFERIFFHTTPSPLSIVGTLIIMSAALYVAVRIGRSVPHRLLTDRNLFLIGDEGRPRQAQKGTQSRRTNGRHLPGGGSACESRRPWY